MHDAGGTLIVKKDSTEKKYYELLSFVNKYEVGAQIQSYSRHIFHGQNQAICTPMQDAGGTLTVEKESKEEKYDEILSFVNEYEDGAQIQIHSTHIFHGQEQAISTPMQDAGGTLNVKKGSTEEKYDELLSLVNQYEDCAPSQSYWTHEMSSDSQTCTVRKNEQTKMRELFFSRGEKFRKWDDFIGKLLSLEMGNSCRFIQGKNNRCFHKSSVLHSLLKYMKISFLCKEPNCPVFVKLSAINCQLQVIDCNNAPSHEINLSAINDYNSSEIVEFGFTRGQCFSSIESFEAKKALFEKRHLCELIRTKNTQYHSKVSSSYQILKYKKLTLKCRKMFCPVHLELKTSRKRLIIVDCDSMACHIDTNKAQNKKRTLSQTFAKSNHIAMNSTEKRYDELLSFVNKYEDGAQIQSYSTHIFHEQEQAISTPMQDAGGTLNVKKESTEEKYDELLSFVNQHEDYARSHNYSGRIFHEQEQDAGGTLTIQKESTEEKYDELLSLVNQYEDCAPSQSYWTHDMSSDSQTCTVRKNEQRISTSSDTLKPDTEDTTTVI